MFLIGDIGPFAPFALASLGIFVVFPVLLAEAVAFYLVQIRDQGAGAFGLAFIIIFLINIPALLAGAFYSHDIIILSLGSFAVSWAISVAIKYAVLRNNTDDLDADHGF